MAMAMASARAVSPSSVRGLDGRYCASASTGAGIALIDAQSRCLDLGSRTSTPVAYALPFTLTAMERWRPLYYLPEESVLALPTGLAGRRAAATLRQLLTDTQHSAPNCASVSVNMLPLIGFGQAIEITMLQLAEAAHLGKPLILGSKSLEEWTSSWFCAQERSPMCYFNLSSGSECAQSSSPPPMTRSQSIMARRRSKLSGRAIGLPGYSQFGTMWIHAQLVHYLFDSMPNEVRHEVCLCAFTVASSHCVPSQWRLHTGF